MHLVQAPSSPRRGENYTTPRTIGTAKGPILRCEVPHCENPCTVSAEELALGFPRLCDTHIYEPAA